MTFHIYIFIQYFSKQCYKVLYSKTRIKQGEKIKNDLKK